ncbi:MAG TPA: Rne/Rng family ribonuclease, partial [Flavobacteriales bacterium]|nr:Rne/Rng family ribonuclease [Flavobacteriales bacterium]
MDTELIIRSSPSAIDFALLKDGKLTELHKEETSNKFNVGDVYMGKINKVIPGLNAAFVNVGAQKDGFLHYHDLGPQIKSLIKYTKQIQSGKLKDYSLKNFSREPDIDKSGNIKDVLKAKQSILVQILKEPISTKGPRLTSEISLAGRYLILVPFYDKVSVSQKIESEEEKERLKRLVKSIKPQNFGVIIRTAAKDKKVADLDKDLQSLITKWQALSQKIQNAHPPQRVLGEGNRVTTMLRDILNDSFTKIVVDDELLYLEILDFIKDIAPDLESIVKLHDSSTPIFEKYGIERQIKSSFGKTVMIDKGAYLIIEHTEAMHVIDVNSGNASDKTQSQEENSLQVNLKAATEIARQLRLRDMGGIIVVDFIDMKDADNRKKLYEHMKAEMADDRAKHKILPLSRFGLMQITRQRFRPERNISTTEKNPSLINKGETDAPITLITRFREEIKRLSDQGDKNIHLHVHPFIAAYLTKGLFSIKRK